MTNTVFDALLQDLRKLFGALRLASLAVKPTKTKLGMKHVNILSHHAGGGLLQSDMDKVSAVANYAKPHNKTELRSFIGLVGYYHNSFLIFQVRQLVCQIC